MTDNETKHFILEAWTSGVFEKLLFINHCQSSSSSSSSLMSTRTTPTASPNTINVTDTEILTKMYHSKIGIPLWSNDFRHLSSSDSPTDATAAAEEEAKLESGSRSRRNVGMTPQGRPLAKTLARELRSKNVEPHLLISPYRFGEEGGVVPNQVQPFTVKVHPQVGFVCDVHSHMSDAEVIGFLAGKWDPESKCLYIQTAVPCTATVREEDFGETDVEIDPEGEWRCSQIIQDLNLEVVGWYHSHPKFIPNPSVIDIQNQQQHQGMMAEESKPFVGLIVSPHEKGKSTNEALHRWFATEKYEDTLGPCVYMPVEIDVNYIPCQYDSISEEEKNFVASGLTELSSKLSTEIQNDYKLLSPASCTPDITTELSNPSVESTPNATLLEASQASAPLESQSSTIEVTSPTTSSSSNMRKSSRAPKPKQKYDDADMNEKYRKRPKFASLDDLPLQQQDVLPSPPRTMFDSLILALLDNTYKSSTLAREILCEFPLEWRCSALTITCLGLYYARSKTRAALLSSWKNSIKMNKVKNSALRWTKLFHQPSNPNASEELLEKLIKLLCACWEDLRGKRVPPKPTIAKPQT